MTAVIIVISLAGIAAGRIPSLRMNRATIAFAGAVILVAAGSISYEDALASVDLNTIVLIFAMMVINANLRLSGFFRIAGKAIVVFADTPRKMAAMIIIISAVLSAFFLNDTIVLMMTPLVAEIALLASRNPLPYPVALAVSANIGSAATFIGNPQNILIGAVSGIPFFTYTAKVLVPVAVSLFAAWLIIITVYRKEFAHVRFSIKNASSAPVYRPLLLKCMASAALLVAAVAAGFPVTPAALAASVLLVITRRVRPERIFSDIDFSILVFFSGLFVITGALLKLDFYSSLLSDFSASVSESIPLFSMVSLALSNIVSNVPAVMLLRPVAEQSGLGSTIWTALALSSTFAGNLTLLGSVANLIVAESAKKSGINLGFAEYLKAGLPVTVVTTAIAVIFLVLFPG